MSTPELIMFPNGTKHWYLNNKLHRIDGPAVEFPSGTKRWYLNDEEYSEQGWRDELFKLNLKKILE